VDPLCFVVVHFLFILNLVISFSIVLSHFRVFIQYRLELRVILGVLLVSRGLGCLLLNFPLLLGIILSQRDTQHLASRLLVVVSVSLSLNDILIASESVSIVHVAQLLHEFIHDSVVPILLLVN